GKRYYLFLSRLLTIKSHQRNVHTKLDLIQQLISYRHHLYNDIMFFDGKFRCDPITTLDRGFSGVSEMVKPAFKKFV
ncbi:MAG: hypothetical protein ACRD5B_14425, partial [Nitrososphaeraceae archaeon]